MDDIAKKTGPPTTEEGWFGYYLNRLSNVSMANIIFGLTGLINNAVCASDRAQRFYGPNPLYWSGCWGGAIILLTSIIYFVGSSKKQISYFKGVMFLQVISIFCCIAMVTAGIFGMKYDFETKWVIAGVNRPNDILVAICGLFGFIAMVIGAHANGELLKKPRHVWDGFVVKKQTGNKESKFRADWRDAPDAEAQLRPMHPVASATSDRKPIPGSAWERAQAAAANPPPPSYDNMGYTQETAKL